MIDHGGTNHGNHVVRLDASGSEGRPVMLVQTVPSVMDLIVVSMILNVKDVHGDMTDQGGMVSFER